MKKLLTALVLMLSACAAEVPGDEDVDTGEEQNFTVTKVESSLVTNGYSYDSGSRSTYALQRVGDVAQVNLTQIQPWGTAGHWFEYTGLLSSTPVISYSLGFPSCGNGTRTTIKAEFCCRINSPNNYNPVECRDVSAAVGAGRTFDAYWCHGDSPAIPFYEWGYTGGYNHYGWPEMFYKISYQPITGFSKAGDSLSAVVPGCSSGSTPNGKVQFFYLDNF